LKELTSFRKLLTKCTLTKEIYFSKGQIAPVNKCKSVRDLHIDFFPLLEHSTTWLLFREQNLEN